MLAGGAERPVLAPPAIRRIRRLKLLTALLLMLALGLALSLYAVVVAQADSRYERERIDELLERRVGTGGEAVRVGSDGTVDVEHGNQPELVGGYPDLYVVELPASADEPQRVVLAPAAPTWPDVNVVGAARDAVLSGAPTASALTATRQGTGSEDRLRALARPVYGADGEARAVVVAVANREPGEERRSRLVSFMWWSAGLLLAFGVLVAVLLSRGRWWVADKVLVRHEQFLRDTAHELRAPVSALHATIDAGLAGAEPAERTLERVSTIVRNTDEVIDDLITMSHMETGREPLRAEPVRLDTLVETLVDARADEPSIELVVHPTVVSANAELLRRAVGNLVDNAVRHGRARDPSARINVTVQDGRIAVADRGPGVRPQLLTHMIERTGNGRRRASGGLGITIAGWVARLHGGHLEAADNPGGGAVFTLELPQEKTLAHH
ncbi:MAG: sensor histidine kinase [Acidimicrobiales bacterium]